MNRRKKIYQVLAALLALGMLLLVAAAVPADVRAEGEGPDEPAPVKPPPITGMNTAVTLSEGEKGEIDPSGTLRETGIEVPLWSEPPPYVEVEAPVVAEEGAEVRSLAVPRRYQDPGDVTCGAAALGMALEFASLGEGASAPSTEALVEDLRRRGLLYEGVGTGAEELAYLARNHGYRGSYAFQGWTLAQLAEQLAEGRPPVVALGANGEGQPGHFVTVTGISADGTWISYNDPVWGEQTVSSEDFLRLWGQQGSSGMIALKAPLSAAADPMLPWMGLFGALSMMAVLVGRESTRKEVKETFQALRRKLSDPRRQGLGGKPEPVYEWKKVQDGTKTVEDRTRKIYDYGTRWVKKGWKWVKDTSKKIYDYGTRMVQKGWKTVKDTSRKVYEYGTRWVRRGWKTVKDTSRKIYKYGTRLVRKGWKKVTSWVKGIWGWVKKTKWKPKYVKERFVKSWRYATKRVPRMVKKKFVKGWHYATKRVPRMVKKRFVKGWHYATKKVPNMVKERFVKGWHYATKKVPNMVKERFVKGWHYATKEVPRYVWKKEKAGWKEVKEGLKSSNVNSPTPIPQSVPSPEEPAPTGTPEGPVLKENTESESEDESDIETIDDDSSRVQFDPEKFAEEIINQLPSEIVELIGEKELAQALENVKTLPDLKIILPWLTGMGMDDVATGPLVKNIDSDMAVRAFGRLIGEPLVGPLATGAGWGLTMYPELKENSEKGASPAEYKADILIDSAGFWGGELAGWIAGAFSSETGPGALGFKLGADVIAGGLYDSWINSIDGREQLTEYFQSQVSDDDFPLPEFTPVPNPTPEPVDPTGGISDTDQVDESAEETLQGTPVPPQMENTEPAEVTPIVTQTPEPTSNP